MMLKYTDVELWGDVTEFAVNPPLIILEVHAFLLSLHYRLTDECAKDILLFVEFSSKC